MKYQSVEKMRNRRTRKRILRITIITFLLAIVCTSLAYAGERYFKRKNVAVGSSVGEWDRESAERANSQRITQMNIEDSNEGTKGIYAKTMSKSTSENKEEVQDPNRKVAHLTFDDGPTPGLTPRILDTLKQYNVKATFFVIGNLAERNKDLVLRETAEGHQIGNHTYTHVYNNIYANTQNFMSDLSKADEVLKSLVPGYNLKIMRFPGGSFGGQRQPYRQAVEQAGYRYFDWNCLNGDADAPKVPVDKLIENIKTTSKGKNNLTVLMHDAPGKDTTADALPKIIEYFKAQGYAFDIIK